MQLQIGKNRKKNKKNTTQRERSIIKQIVPTVT